MQRHRPAEQMTPRRRLQPPRQIERQPFGEPTQIGGRRELRVKTPGEQIQHPFGLEEAIAQQIEQAAEEGAGCAGFGGIAPAPSSRA